MASTTTTAPPATTAAAIAPPPAAAVPSSIGSNSSVTAFYSHVVQHVMQNVRPDFEAEGLDETVLEELQTVCVPFSCLSCPASFVLFPF
jgi:hypothetical protein